MPAAYVAIGSSITAVLLLLSLHVLSPEFSPAWRMVSEYANGRYEWVLSLMFDAYGLAILALAVAIRSELRTGTARIGLGVLVASGIAATSASVFDINHEALHELAGAIGIVGLPVAAVLISQSLSATPDWAPASRLLRWTAHATWISVGLWALSFVVMVVSFVHVLGSLPTSVPSQVPPGAIALVGWTNRLFVICAWAWVALIAGYAIRVSRAASALPVVPV